MKKFACILCLIFSVVLCSCSTQECSTQECIIMNHNESDNMNTIYDIHGFQNDQMNIVVYEYLNGKWNKLISELLDDDTQKIILTLFEPTSEENNYYLQISYQNNLDKNIKELRQITFKENNSLLFHQKNINNMKISKKLQNLVIYEWLENGDVCIYDLNNFSIDDSYNAKRAYLVLISRHN